MCQFGNNILFRGGIDLVLFGLFLFLVVVCVVILDLVPVLVSGSGSVLQSALIRVQIHRIQGRIQVPVRVPVRLTRIWVCGQAWVLFLGFCLGYWVLVLVSVGLCPQ